MFKLTNINMKKKAHLRDFENWMPICPFLTVLLLQTKTNFCLQPNLVMSGIFACRKFSKFTNNSIKKIAFIYLPNSTTKTKTATATTTTTTTTKTGNQTNK